MEKRRSRRARRGGSVLLALALGAGTTGIAIEDGSPRSPTEKRLVAVVTSLPTNVVRRSPPAQLEISGATVSGKPVLSEEPSLSAPTNRAPGKSTAILEAQVALDRLALSPGSIDGVVGSQTRAAIRAFQARDGLPLSGELDPLTRPQLALLGAAVTTVRIESSDLARLLPLPSTWLGKSEQPRLDYETILELMAERMHAHPNLLRRLNPAVDWSSLDAGALINVPATSRVPPETKAASIRIRLAERTLQAFDATNRLLAHFPCSIAARVDKRPLGELRVIVVVPNPDYLFNPENFPESPEARELGRKLRLNPGPNNPVGTAWIGLSLSGYGIHGTPRPEEVGRTESHGCFRLANWNAEYLAELVSVGTPVQIEP